MPVDILRMPAGAGKTETALQRLANTLRQQPFARVWVLVSGRRQEDYFRQRLIEQGASVYFNVEFFSFYQLYHRLLNIARQPPRRLDDAARFALLRAVITSLHDQLTVYQHIAETPGFLRIMADLIYELKQNLVLPETLQAAAAQPKDHDLALIYSRYQERLIEARLVDREGEGWLALSLLESDTTSPPIGSEVDLLLVDGYDQFTRLQAALLMLLAGRVRAAFITLPVLPGAEQTAGRRFERALSQLEQAAPYPLNMHQQMAAYPPRPPDLRQLVTGIFQPDVTKAPAQGDLRLIEAADTGREVAALLRQVKRLLLEGCPPDEILIVLRDWPRYAGLVANWGQAYNLPLALHGGEPLAENPAVMLLLTLLRLHASDYRRLDLLDVLRSPYFDVLSADEIALLEQISQRELVIGGRAAWLSAIRQAAIPAGIDEDGELVPALLTAAESDRLAERLARFFQAVTPPSEAVPAAYVRWVDELVGVDEDGDPDTEPPDHPAWSVRMPPRIREGGAVAGRDLAAIQQVKRALWSLLSAQELLDSLGQGRVLTADAFLRELETMIANTALNRAPARSGRVLVTTVSNARGLPHRHVLIPGLAEGVFPAPLAEDALYLDSERLALQGQGVLLPTSAEQSGDDGLFYELVSLPTESLTLSRPVVQNGAPWPASHLWRAVESLFTDLDVTRIPVGAVVPAGDAASQPEVLLGVAADLCQQQPVYPGIYHWFTAAWPAQWQRVRQARDIEQGRMTHGRAHDHYSGRLRQPELIAHAAAQLGPDRLWSASQLNDYGICGFRFFAKRLLKLEALEQPEEGLNVQMLGTINHEILERTYREIGAHGFTIEPQHLDAALDILRQQAVLVIAEAPAKLGFPADARWELESEALLRRLEMLLRLDFSAQSPLTKDLASDAPRRPYRLEAAFGVAGGPPVSLPVSINGQDETLRLQGFIDRMDRSGDGVIVVDYKSGSTRIPVSEIEIGRNFQMMIYLRAAAQLLRAAPDGPSSVLGGLFWHLSDQTVSGRMLFAEENTEAILDEAQAQLGRYIAAGRQGDFIVSPRKPDKGRCTSYCEYSRLCRVSSTGRHKD